MEALSEAAAEEEKRELFHYPYYYGLIARGRPKGMDRR
jgi:hypothetical protein